VTTADLEVNRILQADLLSAFPDTGWLSEETQDDLKRLENRRVWVIDPIDGTKYFMKGIPQYTISAALVEESRPMVGVVFNPATDELFSAVREAGAWLNEKPIRVNDRHGSRPVILVSPPSWERGRFKSLESVADCRPLGSIAYTLARVAAGLADGAMNVDHLNEWDVAAGVLLVEAAGGTAVDVNGRPLAFNQPRTSIQGLLASGRGLLTDLQAFARRIA
jgi:myo-inositol-1(or 4)-monophosphatase